MRRRTCAIFNHPAHYNEAIYKLMRSELNVDFVFGRDNEIRVKSIELLEEKLGSLRIGTYRLGPLYGYHGIAKLLLDKYDNYILTGDAHCVTNWMILLWAKLKGKKTFLWTHGFYGREGLIRAKLKHYFFSLASHLLLYGEKSKEILLGRGFRPNVISVIYNSLDVQRQLEIRKSLRKTDVYERIFNNNNEVLIHIGRLKKEKNFSLLIEAMSLLRNEGVFLNLMLVGDFLDEKDLNSLIVSQDMSANVFFYGPCYDESVIANYLYNALVCVSPGNVGLTAMHAMVYGLPVITHGNYLNQKPEYEAVIDKKTGSLFLEGDVNSLCEALKFWIQKKKDKSVEVNQDCLDMIIKNYSPTVQIKLLKKLLQ